MVKDSQKQVTVSFPAKLSDELNETAESQGFESIGKYMLNLHENRINRIEKLATIAPHIKYLGYRDDVMTLEDTHANKIVGVRLKDSRLWLIGDSKETNGNLMYKFYCAIHPDFVNLKDSESSKKK